MSERIGVTSPPRRCIAVQEPIDMDKHTVWVAPGDKRTQIATILWRMEIVYVYRVIRMQARRFVDPLWAH